MAQSTALDIIKEEIAPELERLNFLIRSRLCSDSKLMSAVIDNYLTTKGKQIRPIIVMLCARIFGPIDEKVLEAAASVELLHNASLIHDDVVDESKLRRNIPTINAIWDNRIAVLVGDYFVSTALQRAIATGDIRIVDEIGRLGKLLSIGEIEQINNAREFILSEEGYFQIINFKTASLFVACARVGCHAAGADSRLTDCLARIAEYLGLCFQIRDDIFDYFKADKVGKPTGNDLREGKITLPLIHTLLNPALPGHDEMVALASKPELSDLEIATLQQYAIDGGGIAYAYATMESLRAEAATIRDSLPDPSRADSLMKIFDYIIARDY